MSFWQYMGSILGLGVALIALYAFVLIPLGEWSSNRRMRRRQASERDEVQGR